MSFVQVVSALLVNYMPTINYSKNLFSEATSFSLSLLENKEREGGGRTS